MHSVAFLIHSPSFCLINMKCVRIKGYKTGCLIPLDLSLENLLNFKNIYQFQSRDIQKSVWAFV